MGLTTSLLMEINPASPSLEEPTVQGMGLVSMGPGPAGAAQGKLHTQMVSVFELGAETGPASPGFGWAALTPQKVFFSSRKQ